MLWYVSLTHEGDICVRIDNSVIESYSEAKYFLQHRIYSIIAYCIYCNAEFVEDRNVNPL